MKNKIFPAKTKLIRLVSKLVNNHISICMLCGNCGSCACSCGRCGYCSCTSCYSSENKQEWY